MTDDRAGKPPNDLSGEVTRLLGDLEADREALDRIASLVYDDIRKLARRKRLGTGPNPTLQTTAVVHEAFVKLFASDPSIQNRRHLMNLMARVIRQVIGDHARARLAQKRGSDARRLDTDVDHHPCETQDAERVVDLERALDRLEAVDPELVDLVQGYFFGGHTHDELAEITGSSRRTVQRQLKRARIWLRFEIEQGTSSEYGLE